MGYGVSLATSPYPRSVVTLYGTLWNLSDAPVSISALSEITRMDRASIRDALNSFDPSFIERTEQGVILTPAGQRKAYHMFINFYRRIPDESRLVSKAYFSLDKHKLSPARALNAYLLAADTASRRTGFPLTQVLLMALMRSKPVSYVWSMQELMDGTGLTYKRVHKQLQVIIADGFGARTDCGYTFNRKGRLAHLAIFMAGVKFVPKASFKTVMDLSIFAFSPPSTLKIPSRPRTQESTSRRA